LTLNDIKSNSDSATLNHSDKNAKIRDDSKNTTEDDLKCSSSNDSTMKTIPEENKAFENNPKSKLTSADSGSDHSSCDAKKIQGSNIATSHDSDDSSTDSNSQGKDANSSSEDSSTSDDSNAIGDNAPQVDHNHDDPSVTGANNTKEKEVSSNNITEIEIDPHSKPSESTTKTISTIETNHHNTPLSVHKNTITNVPSHYNLAYCINTDKVISLSLFTLSLFLHETNECLINQPSENYHLVEINNLIKKDF